MADPVPDCDGRLPPPATARRARCRSILANLLRPIALEDAARCADLLLGSFRTAPEALAADEGALQRMLAAWPGAAGHLAAVRAALLHCLEVGLESRPVLADYAAVVAYLRVLLAHSPREQIAMLFLDARNQLLAAEVGAPGTIDHAPFYPREILRRALELGAAGVIVGHNHPSGDLDPSAADRVVTAELAAGARALGMVVHDHLILARSGWRSMRAMGLVDP